MQKLFSSTHTLKEVFDIVLDNLVHMNMRCDNIFIILLPESVMNVLSFLYGLKGWPFFLKL